MHLPSGTGLGVEGVCVWGGGERDEHGTVSGGEQVTLHTRNGDSDNLD